MKIKPLPSSETLTRLFRINQTNGQLEWNNPISKRVSKGIPAGTQNKTGRIIVQVDAKKYYAHRIIWKIATGTDPSHILDHKNGNASDNRIENLRECSSSQNSKNRLKSKNNTSGIKNLSFDKSKKLWVASLFSEGRLVFRKYSKDKNLVTEILMRERQNLHKEFNRNDRK